jgi:LCP family protein required for cell wall assembly
MGKHSGSDNKSGPIGRGDVSRSRGQSRRVPAERRRTPGERGTAEAARAGGESYRLSDPAARRRGSLESAPARLKIERDRRRARSKRILAIVAVSLVALAALAAGGVYAYAKYIERTMQSTVMTQGKLGAVLTKAKPMEPVNILVLGADYRKGETKYRTDSMIVAHVDPKLKKIWLISIPRDTKVELKGHGTIKINAAHVYGGPEGAVEATERLTGLKMNHYVEVNFEGFKKAVDAIGGVWIDVPVEIDDIQADLSPGHRAKHVDAGYQRLDGEHSLTFVRARHQFADQDFSRMKNQQLFFRALADSLVKTGNITKLPQVVSAVAPYIKTDMSLVEMIKMAQSLRGAGSQNIHTATLKGPWISPYIIVDPDQMAGLIKAMNEGRSFEPTASTPASGTATSGKAAPVAAKKPTQITITVRNGSGMSGVAKQAASILKAKTFSVGEVGNANQNVYSNSMVIYKTDRAAAELVASALPPGTKIVQSRGMYSFTTDILVVIGKDWDVAKVPAAPITSQ